MKPWYSQPVTDEDVKEARGFLAVFGARLHIRPVSGGGEVNVDTRLITISPLEKKYISSFWSLILHELQHILCFQAGLYKNFHNYKEHLTAAETRRFRRIALKAELFVDKRAELMMIDYFPGVPYCGVYRNAGEIKWFRENYLDKYYKG
jgi:hypothetical protein